MIMLHIKKAVPPSENSKAQDISPNRIGRKEDDIGSLAFITFFPNFE